MNDAYTIRVLVDDVDCRIVHDYPVIYPDLASVMSEMLRIRTALIADGCNVEVEGTRIGFDHPEFSGYYDVMVLPNYAAVPAP